MSPEIGQMIRVDLRDAWANEALDFTPWLAENIHILGNAIGLTLEVQAQEQMVGNFRADIVALDVVSGSSVLIENQIEKTDHSHLGQLITYASGLRTPAIVWIAREFTQEHRAALDWLNEISYNAGGSAQFFGLEIELWRIETSGLACKLNVVASPNAWKRSINMAVRSKRSRGDNVLAWKIQRLLIDEPGLSARAVAARIGCSPTTASEWKKFFEDGGQLDAVANG